MAAGVHRAVRRALAGLWPYGAAALSAGNGLDAIQLPELPLARVEARLVRKHAISAPGATSAVLLSRGARV
jgi:hypothetical protein